MWNGTQLQNLSSSTAFSDVKQNKYNAFSLTEDTIIIAFICNFIRKIENGLITYRNAASIMLDFYFLLILSLLEFLCGRKYIMPGFSLMYKIRLYFWVNGSLIFLQSNFIFLLSSPFLVYRVLIFITMSSHFYIMSRIQKGIRY